MSDDKYKLLSLTDDINNLPAGLYFPTLAHDVVVEGVEAPVVDGIGAQVQEEVIVNDQDDRNTVHGGGEEGVHDTGRISNNGDTKLKRTISIISYLPSPPAALEDQDCIQESQETNDDADFEMVRDFPLNEAREPARTRARSRPVTDGRIMRRKNKSNDPLSLGFKLLRRAAMNELVSEEDRLKAHIYLLRAECRELEEILRRVPPVVKPEGLRKPDTMFASAIS
ncbi:hypothetical protein PNOK_0914400 [Pyrrhoderma noxium]|uniref:Uncharacterized protein n=1 Tax=Pyrrhoderma noxium TaxID=2282107 RepID=A0A286U724_9AGAM|nr:hypothetical protein PNOK_0914400 [Pyrrhoderma noxium]